MDDGGTTASRSTGGMRTSQVDASLRMLYWWVCVGVLILSALLLMSIPVGVYLAWTEGRFEPELWIEVHRVTSALLHSAAVVAAVQALRRSRRAGYGRWTLIAGTTFTIALAVTMLGMALLW